MNILFFCNPSSVHDQKWIFRLSKRDEINICLISDQPDYLHDEELVDFCNNNNIVLLPPVSSFSIKRLPKTWRSARQLNKAIKENNIDLLHFMFATPYAFWANFIKVPFIISTRGSDVLIVAPSLLMSKGIRKVHDKVLFKLLKRAFSKAAHITSTSAGQKNKIKTLFAVNDDKLSVIPTGIDVKAIIGQGQKCLPEVLRNKQFIFSPRYIRPVYNTEMQINAIMQLPGHIKEKYSFVFIKGKEANREYQSAMLTKLNNIPALDYYVFDSLSQEEMWGCFNAAKLTFMVPESDGTPNSGLEAMAAGSPLIIGNLDYDQTFFNNETCIKLNSNDSKELAQQMVFALTDYPKELIKNAVAVVKQHTDINHSLEQIIELYNKAH